MNREYDAAETKLKYNRCYDELLKIGANNQVTSGDIKDILNKHTKGDIVNGQCQQQIVIDRIASQLLRSSTFSLMEPLAPFISKKFIINHYESGQKTLFEQKMQAESKVRIDFPPDNFQPESLVLRIFRPDIHVPIHTSLIEEYHDRHYLMLGHSAKNNVLPKSHLSLFKKSLYDFVQCYQDGQPSDRERDKLLFSVFSQVNAIVTESSFKKTHPIQDILREFELRKEYKRAELYFKKPENVPFGKTIDEALTKLNRVNNSNLQSRPNYLPLFVKCNLDYEPIF